MIPRFAIALAAAVLPHAFGSTGATAQNAPPSYQADPDVYRLIFEDQYFRVIASNRQKGVRDKDHSHPVPGITYFLTDCQNRVYTPDGKVRDTNEKAGSARAVPIIPSHSAENIGPSECRMLIVERK